MVRSWCTQLWRTGVMKLQNQKLCYFFKKQLIGIKKLFKQAIWYYQNKKAT